jgi:broad specificity phosphatase PhoE
MALTIFFMRHGETDHSRDDLYCGSGSDPDLTERGAQMAHAFANAYGSKQWSALYCSPAKRARATVQPLAEMLSLTPGVEPGLHEIRYGEWEGKTRDEVRREFPNDYLVWTADPGWNPPTAGETAIEIERRARKTVDDIVAEHPDGNVLVVSHKATIRVIVCSLLDMDIGRYRIRLECPVASLTVFQFTRHGPQLLRLADRSHLGGLLSDGT